MNNFTKSSGRAYWHSITNCSPGFRKLQKKSMKAMMLVMFFVMGTGAIFAQQAPEEIIVDDKVNGCQHDVPVPSTDQGDLATIMDFTCTNNGDIHIELRAEEQVGILHQATGFAAGSDHCEWTYYYVYDVKCTGNNEIVVYTLTYSGGDYTAPQLIDPKNNPVPPNQEGLWDTCYDERPVAPTAGEIAALYQDNCSHVKVSEMTTKRTRSKNSDCSWTEINTYTIGDYCNKNYFEVTITYSGGDKVDPVFVKTPEQNIGSYYCDEIPVAETLSWNDNCGESGKAYAEDKNDFDCSGGFVDRTWTITDKCGNSTSFTQKITILPARDVKFEETPLVVNIPCYDRENYKDYFPEYLDYSNSHDKVHYEDAPNGDDSYICEVSGSSPAVVIDEESIDLELSCSSFTVEYTYADECNDIITVVTVNIVDDIKPSITQATDSKTVDCDGSGNLSDYADWLGNYGGAKAEDNCDTNLEWSHDAGDRPLMGGCSEFTGKIFVTFFVQDDCGNINKTGGFFEIIDDTAPTMTPADDFRAVCDGTGNTEQYLKWVEDRANATASDACDSDLEWWNDAPILKKDESIAGYLKDGCSDYTGEITITFYVKDDCGNISSDSATFSVEDSIAPVINTPAANVTVECDSTLPLFDLQYDLADTDGLDESNYHYTTNLYKLIVWLHTNGGAGNVDEVCSDVKWSKELIDWELTGCYGYITVKFTATDECDNASSTTATFRVEDTLTPIITEEAHDGYVECGERGDEDPEGYSAFEEWLDNSAGASAYDKCDKDLTWTHNWTPERKFSDECGETGGVNVIFTATDNCGWSSTTAARFEIVDTTAPDLYIPRDITIYRDADCKADISSDNTGLATGDDECGGVIISKSDVSNKTLCTETITRTWTATDECGNATSKDQIITIRDNMAPVQVTAVPDKSNLDLCEAPEGPSVQDVINAFTDNCTDVLVTKTTNVIDTNVCGWATQFIFTIEDECGNRAPDLKVLYWGSDQSAPVLAENSELPKGASDVDACFDNRPVGPSVDDVFKLFVDNCDDKFTVKKDETVVKDDDCDWEVYYTYTLTDACNNSDSFNVYYDGGDDTEPALVGVLPTDISGVDSCVDTYEAHASLSEDAIAQLFYDCGDVNVDRTEVAFGGYGENCDWSITYIYDVYDNCNNHVDEFKINVFGSDQTAPKLECPEGIDFAYGDDVVIPNHVLSIEDCADTTEKADNSDHVHTTGEPVAGPDRWRMRLRKSFRGHTFYVDLDLGLPIGTYNGSDYYEGSAFFANTQIPYGNNIYRLYNATHADDWHLDEKSSPNDPTWTKIGYTYYGNHDICASNNWPGAPSGYLRILCNGSEQETVKHSFTRTFTVTDACGNTSVCEVDYSYLTLANGSGDSEDGLPDEVLNGDFSDVSEEEAVETESAPTVAAPDTQVTLDFKAYPVPFNKDVNLNYNFDFDTDVTIEVYDTKGLLVKTQVNRGYKAGSDVVLPMSIQGADQLYYVKLITNRGTVTKKIVSSNVNKQ